MVERKPWASVTKRWGSVTDATGFGRRDSYGMFSDDVPVQLNPGTVDALAAVRAWGRAFNERDLDRLLMLSTRGIRLGDHAHGANGHDGLRRMLELQSYGVAQHAYPIRYTARGSTVAVEASLEFHWVDSGELADASEGVAVFELRDGQVERFRAMPDLAAAVRAVGWPAPGMPAHARPPAREERSRGRDLRPKSSERGTAR
jgi:hypothetical protein